MKTARSSPPKKKAKKTSAKKQAKKAAAQVPDDQRWELRLYVAGKTPKCIAAFAHLKQICEEHLQNRYSIEVVDLLENPLLAAGDQIIAIPTLVRKLPAPMKKIIGDLTNTERVIVGLNLMAKTPPKRARW